MVNQDKRALYLKEARKNKKIEKFEKNFDKYESENWFRINSMFEALDKESLIIEMFIKSLIGKNLKLINDRETAEDVVESLKLKNEEYKADLMECIERVESSNNEKSIYCNYDKAMFFVLLDKEIMLATALIKDDKAGEITEVIHNNTYELPEGVNDLQFVASEKMQTAISKLNDTSMAQVFINAKNELELQIVNLKTGKIDYYGVLGYSA